MAKKSSVLYVCSNCGETSSVWAGRCKSCGEWNSLQEEVVLATSGRTSPGHQLAVRSIAAASQSDELKKRYQSGLGEVDMVLGGGIVPGSVILLAGEPGIGKSTILLQVADFVAKKLPVLYVSGEESAHQIGLRAGRLGAKAKDLQLATAYSANDVAATIASGKYKLVVVDSIQTLSVNEIGSAPGTVTQITGSARLLGEAAKTSGVAIILVGHVTKEGSIAGPKVLEHSVDVVLQLEGDRYGGFKVLRSVKNRFGGTNEAGIFEMGENGLTEVENPSAALLAERQISDGSVVLATMEGSRALLVEVQALVNPTSYGYPKRTASGIELNRLNLLVAMLERRTKLKLSANDIFVNIVGGIKLTEPAADLAVCMAIASAAKSMQLKQNAVVFGEVGLSGEVRHVPFVEKRLAEARKLGFKSAVGPVVRRGQKPAGLASVTDVRSALNKYLEKDTS